MKGRHPNNRVNPTSMVTVITELFNPILTRPQLKNLIVTVIAIALATSFRINAIASRLPIGVSHFKTKQKRLLRFLARRFPINAVMRCWLGFVVSRICRCGTGRTLILIDETQVFGDFKAIVAAVPFRQRAIPIYWHIYTDAEIQQMKYKSHNAIIQRFCITVYRQLQATLPPACEPVLLFDRGFARGRYVIAFLKAQQIPFVMRVLSNVRITVWGRVKTLKQLQTTGFYRQILYHATEQIPINLYVVRDARCAEPMYLISNLITGQQIHHYYKRRMQIEHGFRDIKTGFGFGKLKLKIPTKARINLLWLLACLCYGFLFLTYQKSAHRWAKAFNTNQKTYSLITVIKRVIEDAWAGGCLKPGFTLPLCRGDTL